MTVSGKAAGFSGTRRASRGNVDGSTRVTAIALAEGARPIYPWGVLVRVGLMLVALVMVLLVLGAVLSRRRDAPRPATAPAPRARPAPRRYDWERRSTQLYRAWKQVPGPAEDREGILAFVTSRQGVEAYVEPRTVIHPLSVVLIAEDGEWRRFELRDDAYLRELVKERGLRVLDASRFGYPERMKRRPPGDGDEA